MEKDGQTKVFGAFIAATISTLALQPFEIIKTRKQVNRLSVLHNCRLICAKKGFFGFWVGTAPSMYRAVPGISVYFPLLYYFRNFVCDSRKPSWTESFLIGCFARSVIGTIFLPFTVVKTLYETGNAPHRRVFNSIYILARDHGFQRLFSGLVSTLTRDVPYSGIFVMLYWHMSDWLSSNFDASHQHQVLVSSSSAFMSSLIACFISHPADAIKTQRQAFNHSPPLFNLIKSMGIRGVYAGFVLRTIRKNLSSVISWTTFEMIIRHA